MRRRPSGIPLSYVIKNDKASKLGTHTLLPRQGAHLHQDQGGSRTEEAESRAKAWRSSARTGRSSRPWTGR